MWDQSLQHLLWLNHFISHSSTATLTALEYLIVAVDIYDVPYFPINVPAEILDC